jgi:hypothetical protein
MPVSLIAGLPASEQSGHHANLSARLPESRLAGHHSSYYFLGADKL